LQKKYKHFLAYIALAKRWLIFMISKHSFNKQDAKKLAALLFIAIFLASVPLVNASAQNLTPKVNFIDPQSIPKYTNQLDTSYPILRQQTLPTAKAMLSVKTLL
jgi:hypothetical protein